MKNIIWIAALLILFTGCNMKKTKMTGPVKVTLENVNGKYRLFVDGEEFFVKGAGCECNDVALLAKHGANSFRTWMDQEGHPAEDTVLEKAHKHGLKVLMGLKIGRERHGYDYDNEEWVASQYEMVMAKVMRYKDHPALLGWAIGNEVNLGANNLKVFDAIDSISRMIHEVDPNHVTTTTLAGIGKREVDYIKEHCTDIDFISIQMYGDIVNLQKRIDDAGWNGPYMVTEWGATGHWEVARTEWDVAIEPTSQEKAHSFLERYKIAIEADSVHCLGSYVFLWGQKQERTPTWYGMLLESGERTETVDAMQKIWTGKWPENRCPTVDSFTLNGKNAIDNIYMKKGENISANVIVRDSDRDALSYKWEILSESTDLGWGGDKESKPETLFSEVRSNPVELTAPDKVGAYRLFVYVLDGNGGAATANIPFFVKSK